MDIRIYEVVIVKKFDIPSIPPTTAKTIRFPNDIIKKIEMAITGTGCTFSAFVVKATREAVESLEQEEDKAD